MTALARVPGAGRRGRPPSLTHDEALKVQHRVLVLGESANAVARDLDVSPETVAKYARGFHYGLLVEPVDHGSVGRHGANVTRAKRGEPRRFLELALTERDRSETSPCWTDWPYASMWSDRPSIALSKHPLTGRRWSGPVVKLAWFIVRGEWPGELAHRCQRDDCWNVGHTYEALRGQNVADYWRLANFVSEHDGDVSAVLALVSDEDLLAELKRRNLPFA